MYQLWKPQIQNQRKVTEIKVFQYFYHVQLVIFLPADTQQVFSFYFLCSSLWFVYSVPTAAVISLHQPLSLNTESITAELDPDSTDLMKLIRKQLTKL